MKRKIKKYGSLFLISATLTSSVATLSCNNIRQVNHKDSYIKKYNEPNKIKDNFIINKVKRIDNDFESLLTAPLIRWKSLGKSKFDHLNKFFYKTTTRFLEFYLAKSITVTLKDNSQKIFNSDDVKEKVDQALQSSTKVNEDGALSGIKQIYSDENNNINSKEFFEALNSATKIEFELKDDVYYSDYKGKKTNHKLQAQDYLTSFNLKQNREQFSALLDNYSLKNLGQNSIQNNKLIFELNDAQKSKNNNFIKLFTTQEITNNLIFNPISTDYYKNNKNSYGKNYQNICFIGYYVLNKNTVDEQIFIKNNNSALDSFNQNEKQNILNKVTIKYNPIQSDEPTFRLQSYNAFKQNLLSEASYDIFNQLQKDEIDNFSNLFGVTYTLFKPNNSNVISYFYNVNPYAKNNKDFKFNEAFSLLFYNQKLKELKDQNLVNKKYYEPHQIVFRNILNNCINQYSFIKNLNHNTYWNSFASQSLNYDSSNNSGILDNQNVNFLDDINRVYDYHFDSKTNKFDNKIIDFNGSDGLIKHSINSKNILDINEQLKSANYQIYQNEMKQILDDFYSKNGDYKNQKIQFTLPIFAEKSSFIDSLYKRIAFLYNNLDNRLNVNFEYASKEANNYFSKYQNFSAVDNSFSNYLINLITANNQFFLNLFLYSKVNLESINYDKNIKKIISTIEETINKVDYFKNYELQKIKANSSLLDQILQKNNLKLKEFKARFKEKIQALNFDQQFNILKSIDSFLGIRVTEDNFLFTNEYQKSIVQYFYTKPINLDGFTYFQDITFN
ncbi:OppA family ABC transporter substrate-binding lipoprotein [Mycoplasmopsis fermentans]|uniref:OppA family ABC transporter substrate-binding lipoprotein n=1 Tax=Mycoplasmopsis fermentans TaxID=2115 RepID=UPI0001E32F3E|nr:hypothetical protein [Mycoplasmopsis fermentans]ADN69212.1 conserved hypothetical membrane associated protein [Mycoplasmopsis fermentans JER]